MCAPSAPAAPDYKGAAEATAQSQRINQYTPYGSLTYNPVTPTPTAPTQQQPQPQQPQQPQQAQPGPQGGFYGAVGDALGGGGYNTASTPRSVAPPPGGGTSAAPQQWQSTLTLDPEAQKALESQMRLSSGMGALGETQLGAVQDRFSQPMDMQSVQDVADKAYSAQTARLDPMWNARSEQNRTMLANQGLAPGGEAYGNAMRDFEQARNDAYQQANLASIATMPQTYQLATSAYNQPLNALNAIRTGAQVQNPQFGGLGQPTNYAQAAQQQGLWNQDLFNQRMGAYNSQLSGAATIGAAAISDRRLKRNIERVGTHPLGIGIYEYDIFERREVGVMADEVERVLPQAVITGADGYKRVYYAML